MGKYSEHTKLKEWSNEDLISLIKLMARKAKENGIFNGFKHNSRSINHIKDDIILRSKERCLPDCAISTFWDTFYHAFNNEPLSSALTLDIVNDPRFFDFFEYQDPIIKWVDSFTRREVEFALGCSVNSFRNLNIKCGLILKRYVDKYDDIMHYYNKASLLNIPGFAEKIKRT
jgi:hypothetical protein